MGQTWSYTMFVDNGYIRDRLGRSALPNCRRARPWSLGVKIVVVTIAVVSHRGLAHRFLPIWQ